MAECFFTLYYEALFAVITIMFFSLPASHSPTPTQKHEKVRIFEVGFFSCFFYG